MPQTPTARIAVVDDEEPVRRALHRLIRAAGYLVEAFASGREFLDSTARSPPACVVLDLNMPQMNGFEVHAQMRRRGLETRVIVITGHDTDEARERSTAAGAFAYLCKPIDAAELLNAIHDAVACEDRPASADP